MYGLRVVGWINQEDEEDEDEVNKWKIIKSFKNKRKKLFVHEKHYNMNYLNVYKWNRISLKKYINILNSYSMNVVRGNSLECER